MRRIKETEMGERRRGQADRRRAWGFMAGRKTRTIEEKTGGCWGFMVRRLCLKVAYHCGSASKAKDAVKVAVD